MRAHAAVLQLAILLLASGAGGPACAELRDPFMFGPGGPGDAVPEQPPPVLVGVVWSLERPMAIVDDQTVAVGAAVGGWQVADIQPDGITIERAGRREFVTPGNAFPAD